VPSRPGSTGGRAIVGGLLQFARSTGVRLIPEGIETGAEQEAMVALGLRLEQGYLLGRPAEAGAA